MENEKPLSAEEFKKAYPELAESIKTAASTANDSYIDGIRKRVIAKNRQIKKITGADFKCRASMAGEIMTDGRGKPPQQIFEEAKEATKKWEEKYEQGKDRKNKALEAIDEKKKNTEESIEKWREEQKEATPSRQAKLQDQIQKKEAYLKKLEQDRKDAIKEHEAKLADLKAGLFSAREEEQSAYATSKEIHLSATCKSALRKWAKEKITGRRREIETKQTYKGKVTEDAAIELYDQVMGTKSKKNDQRLESDWATGEFDYMPTKNGVHINKVNDNKSSWDVETFPMFKDELPGDNKTPNAGYYGQLQTYMHLLIENKIVKSIDDLKAELVYTLVNAPDEVIESEIRYKARSEYKETLTKEEEEEIYYKMTFDNMPPEMKIKIYRFDLDLDYIERFKERVELCRRWIDEVMLKETEMIVEIKD